VEKRKFSWCLCIGFLVVLAAILSPRIMPREQRLFAAEETNRKPVNRALVDTTDLSLHVAAMDGNLGKVQQFIKQGKNVNGVSAVSIDDPKNPGINPGKTPLHLAAVAGQLSVVELLIKSGAEIDSLDGARLPPLYFAASAALGTYKKQDYEAVTKLLIEKGARTTGQERSGKKWRVVGTRFTYE
jgi:ankyrin repeat protein